MSLSNYDPNGTLVCISGGGMPQIENAVGALKAIVEHGYKVDVMMGTSAGALVSGLFMSYDQDINALEDVIKTTPIDKWFKFKPWQIVKSALGLSNYICDNTGLKDFLVETITQDTQKRVRVGITGYDAAKIGKSYLVDGRARHILASMSFPNVFPPVRWGGRCYCDGGVLNNCPIPRYTDLAKYKQIFIILGAGTQFFKGSKITILDRLCNLVDKSMGGEFAQIKEMKLEEAPNIIVFQPPKYDDSCKFLGWSDGFKQIETSQRLMSAEILMKKAEANR